MLIECAERDRWWSRAANAIRYFSAFITLGPLHFAVNWEQAQSGRTAIRQGGAVEARGAHIGLPHVHFIFSSTACAAVTTLASF